MQRDLSPITQQMKEACLFCNSDELFPYFLSIQDHLHIAKKKYDFFRCKNCGSLRIVPLPSKEELQKSYPEECHFNLETGHKIRRLWNKLEWDIFYRPVLKFSVNLIRKTTGVLSGRVLDVGCGNGLRLLQFWKAGYIAEGLDFVSANVNYAKSVLGLNVWEGNIEEQDLLPKHYNLVIAYWLMEHLLKPADLVRKTRDSLVSGGWVAFAVPLADSWSGWYFGAHWASIREAPRHIGIPTFAGMSSLLKNYNFNNIKARPVSSFELAADIALTLWPRGNFCMTVDKRASLKIIDRIITALLTFIFFVPISVSKISSVKQGLTVFMAQKKD